VSRISADVGGTFTDVILQRPDGSLSVRKVLSSPPLYDQAVVGAIQQLVSSDRVEPPTPLEEVVHGTTVATNAVLERRGAITALVTTKGFRDVLELRRVRTPHHYDNFWNKPPALVARRLRFEFDERVMADGTVLQPFDEGEARSLAKTLRAEGVEAIAVCFLHAHRHPRHEQLIGEILRHELPDVPVSLSSEIIREQQEYERSAATAVNAYVQPLMSEYLTNIQSSVAAINPDAGLMIMQSSGGLMNVDTAAARPVYALESGPAAGVIATASVARRLKYPNVIAFDMGGTTAKASLVERGAVSISREYEVGGAMSAGGRLLRGSGELIRVPSVDIVEVGAGGGSIAFVDLAGALQVGPRSAGANPGPACYDRGGSEPTVTDANVVLGYIPSGRLGGGELLVSPELAGRSIERVAQPLNLSVLEAARGIHSLANARMMRALRSVSSEKGRDPRDFTLVAYGGAGPIHAAALAEELGVTSVVIPPGAGLFSSLGILFARVELHDVRFCKADARDPDLQYLRDAVEEMRPALAAAIGSRYPLDWVLSADVRYLGQSWDIEVPLPGGDVTRASVDALVRDFEAEHERQYGVRLEEGAPVEIRAIRLCARAPETIPSFRVRSEVQVGGASGGSSDETREADFGPDFGRVPTPVVSRAAIGTTLMPGPLLIDEYDTTVVVPPGWSIKRDDDTDILLLERAASSAHAQTRAARSAHHPNAVTQQVVANALATVADEMAATIFRTAHSTVVRDALDYSTALCDAGGETVAQSVTIPFHLGSVPAAMESLLVRYGADMHPGDIFAMNDPFDGGIHTSDIFIVKPVFDQQTLVAFAVTVAHHGDVGGRLPGTTATDNTEIFQEGLRMPWIRLYTAGEPVPELFRVIEANVRIPRMTLGDLSAQVAACMIGERGLLDLIRRYPDGELQSLCEALKEHSEVLVRREIESWPDRTVTSVDYMDSDGFTVRPVPIRVELTVAGSDVIVDLSGSSDMVRGALNATRSFAQASVYQPILAAVESDVPLTSGAFRPIKVVTRPGSVAHVVMPGASSQRGVTGFRILDAVNRALAQVIPRRVPAAGEGGNSIVILSGVSPLAEPFIFYELVVGTWGGRPTADGNDGLSNPSATAANIPVEVAETDFPILVQRYGLVQDSGGPGLYRGGLAIEREWRVLVPEVSLQVRSDRQVHRPYGLEGGSDGWGSLARISSADGTTRDPGPMFSVVLQSGDVLYHRTGGGGGWGPAIGRDVAAVADDVENGKIGVIAARDLYGVVMGPDGTVDGIRTAQLRAAMANGRGGRGGPE
jgi:5-oxoprolinase (ATP-hydrolysing)